MKNNLHITATFDQPELLNNLVEKLAWRRNHYGRHMSPLSPKRKLIETSSTETYVSGTIALSDETGTPVNMPFITSFLFTCLRENGDSYKIAWGLSLS